MSHQRQHKDNTRSGLRFDPPSATAKNAFKQKLSLIFKKLVEKFA